MKDREKALLPKVSGDSNNKDDKGRVKVPKSQFRQMVFLGSRVLFYDIAEEAEFLSNVVQFSSDGQTVYLKVHEGAV
jgi:hypothetical protein